MALAVIERQKAREGSLSRNLVRKRDGIQSAGTDDEGLHEGSLF
jgi:hypothetical protein